MPAPMTGSALRPGEVAAPAGLVRPGDAALAFIGHLRTPWRQGDCPRSLRLARGRGGGAAVELLPGLAPALTGLAPGQWLMLLYWLGEGRRDLLLQAPGHAEGPVGTFALRSPVRPNPIGLSRVRLVAIEGSVLRVRGLDCLDGTPLLDIKPDLCAFKPKAAPKD